MTEKFGFLRPSELNGRSISAVEQSQNFLGSILKMWATFRLLIYTNKNISIYMCTLNKALNFDREHIKKTEKNVKCFLLNSKALFILFPSI